MTDLTERDRAILEFEAGPVWRYQGAREDEIRRRFDMTATRYAQVLNALLDRPEAEAHDPRTVRRLRRVRDARRAHRAAS